MRAFVTGATGFIGYHVARLLVEKFGSVRALVRERSDLSALKNLDVELVYGDLRDRDAVRRGVKGCGHVYHVAADYRLWVPDPRTMYEINVGGTETVMACALRQGVERVVYTSSVGVWPGTRDGNPSCEETPSRLGEMIGPYKRTKFLAEQRVFRFVREGLPAVIVNPSTPVGPGDRKPTPTGKVIVDFLNGKIPAYLDTGLNFIDVEDAAVGHRLAAEKGRIGERYILGNENLTLKSFFEKLARLTDREAPKYRLPYFPVLLAAAGNEAASKWITRKAPRIPLTGVRMAKKRMFFDASKAVGELSLPQRPVERALGKAVVWFHRNGYTG